MASAHLHLPISRKSVKRWTKTDEQSISRGEDETQGESNERWGALTKCMTTMQNHRVFLREEKNMIILLKLFVFSFNIFHNKRGRYLATYFSGLAYWTTLSNRHELNYIEIFFTSSIHFIFRSVFIESRMPSHLIFYVPHIFRNHFSTRNTTFVPIIEKHQWATPHINHAKHHGLLCENNLYRLVCLQMINKY